MGKLARALSRIRLIDSFAVGQAVRTAILIGALLTAWPVLAECYPEQCEPCGPCGSPATSRFWVSGQYLLWWTRGTDLPPLVTTSPVGTEPDQAGVLGQPGTSIPFGNHAVNTDATSGGRLAMGYWFDDCQCSGIEASYLGIGEETARFYGFSSQTPILARPFYDTDVRRSAQSALLVAHPDFLRGWIDCELTSRFQAVEVLWRRNLYRQACSRMDFLLGWRFARLDESLRIDQFSEWTESQGPIVVGTTKSFFDSFDVENRFNGVELGVVHRGQAGRWSLEAAMKVGLGRTRSRVFIDGATATTVPDGGTTTILGDLLAQETNMGRYSRSQFAVMPEFGVALGYDLTCQLRATFGYTFLYWSRVARPADQIETSVSQLPPEPPTGSLQPGFSFNTTDYWAQGMNFGLEYRF